MSRRACRHGCLSSCSVGVALQTLQRSPGQARQRARLRRRRRGEELLVRAVVSGAELLLTARLPIATALQQLNNARLIAEEDVHGETKERKRIYKNEEEQKLRATQPAVARLCSLPTTGSAARDGISEQPGAKAPYPTSLTPSGPRPAYAAANDVPYPFLTPSSSSSVLRCASSPRCWCWLAGDHQNAHSAGSRWRRAVPRSQVGARESVLKGQCIL